MQCTYEVIENLYKNGEKIRIAFGIAAIESVNKTVLESYPDLSINFDLVENLVNTCNRLELSIIHLRDVVEDFLAVT